MLKELQSAVGERYRVTRELGGGGMSRVFLATEEALGRPVVIKVLTPELASVTSAARFKRETEVTAQLQHPHILPVLTAGEAGPLLYYVTPYIEGESLRHRINREGKLPVADAVRILSEVASALAYAHERGIVHRDIKPENILLSNGLAVVADFGISSLASALPARDTMTRLTHAGTSLGTPGYMSPEQCAGESALDGRSDVYSLAVVGFEMLAGQAPFSGTSQADLIVQHLTAPAPTVSAFRADTPQGVVMALSMALAKRPDDRYATAAAFRDALGVTYVTPARAAVSRRHVVTVAVAIGVAVVGALLLMRARPSAATGEMDANLIAIAPFDAIGPEAAMLREGLVDLLAANLDGAGPLHTVSPSVSMRAWPDSARADRASALAFAHRVRAGLAVFGAVVPAGPDSVRLRVSILDVARQAPIGSEVQIIAQASRIDRLSDTLSIAILNEVNQARQLTATRRSSLGSTSLPAIKAYLQGEQHYRRGGWDSAAVHYRRALASDSNFASAFRRLGNSLGWRLTSESQLDREGYGMLLRAGQLNRGLAPRESLLVAADSLFAAMMLASGPGSAAPYGGVVRLTRLLETAVQRFGDDPELWYKLGDVRLHLTRNVAPSLPSAADARRAFERAVSIDSAFGPAYVHLVELSADDQDVSAMRRYIASFLALSPGGDKGEALALVAQVLDPRAPQELNRDSLFKEGKTALLQDFFVAVSPLLDSGETATNLARAGFVGARAAGAPPPFVSRLRWGLASQLALRGHYRELISVATDEQASLLYEAGILGAVPADSAEQWARRWSRSGDPFQSAAAASWWAERHDTAQLNAVVASAASTGAPPVSAGVKFLFRGLQSIARSDTAAAIAAFSAPDSVCAEVCSFTNLWLARLHSLQHHDSLASIILTRHQQFNSGMRVMWELERGRVLERLGRVPPAIDGYAYVVSAWSGGDSAVQGFVNEARAGLQRLTSDKRK